MVAVSFYSFFIVVISGLFEVVAVMGVAFILFAILCIVALMQLTTGGIFYK